MGEFGSVCFQFTTDADPGVSEVSKKQEKCKKIRKYEFGSHPFDPKLNEDYFSIFGVNVYVFLYLVS